MEVIGLSLMKSHNIWEKDVTHNIRPHLNNSPIHAEKIFFSSELDCKSILSLGTQLDTARALDGFHLNQSIDAVFAETNKFALDF
jgi:hypothetical protein